MTDTFARGCVAVLIGFNATEYNIILKMKNI